jgi:hypothetical protein
MRELLKEHTVKIKSTVILHKQMLVLLWVVVVGIVLGGRVLLVGLVGDVAGVSIESWLLIHGIRIKAGLECALKHWIMLTWSKLRDDALISTILDHTMLLRTSQVVWVIIAARGVTISHVNELTIFSIEQLTRNYRSTYLLIVIYYLYLLI